jgi:hypothetical protein
MGEILAAQTEKFDSYSTLTWENIVFLDKNEVLLYIPSTKTSTRGDFLDLFPLNGHPCCPVAALKKLKELQVEGGGGEIRKKHASFHLCFGEISYNSKP